MSDLAKELFTNDQYKKVILKNYGDAKLAVIKLLRELTDKDLKEAKLFVECPPSLLMGGLSEIEAERIQSEFAHIGAIVEIK